VVGVETRVECIITRENPERGYAAVLGGTLFLGRTVALTGSIFELAELHSWIHFRCYGKWSVWFASVLDLQYGREPSLAVFGFPLSYPQCIKVHSCRRSMFK